MSKPLRMLIVEDSEDDALFILHELRKGGYGVTYERVDTAPAMSAALDKQAWDVVISDYVMPHFSAPDALILLKSKGIDVPFIVVSGKIGEDIAVATMKAGAHDYVRKDNLSRLVPVVRWELREVEVRRERGRAEETLQQSYEKLRRVLEETAVALGSAIEKRDPYTAGHQQRVAQLACAIARGMGLSKSKIEGIRVAGILHDIGKIYIPAEILSKPGSITEIEFQMIKTHPRAGYDILRDIEFPWPVAQITLQHHERMDGSGYPSGLSGEDILLEARILGVADVVEAISSHRPYRPALGIDMALDEISQKKGTLYDLDVVNACLTLFQKEGFGFN